ncbi:MAG: response regulator transcription factor, partial [Glaciimonas sp.]|nr:response regulator transcription factor [Glaciimonas sp.]
MNKILLVDDHPIVLLALRRLLEKNGYEIVGEAENGVDALNLARQLKPDLVVLDIMVPQLDSMEMLKRLQIYEPTMRVLVL